MFTTRHPALTAILLGGLVAGTIDIGSACVINMRSPLVITHAIASGVLGKDSFHGGLGSALLGLLLQWGMGIIIAAIYMLATAKFPALRRHWLPTGILAGVVIYFVMVYVVLPFSAAPFRQEFSLAVFIKNFAFDKDFFENMLAMMLFGCILGYFARKVPAG